MISKVSSIVKDTALALVQNSLTSLFLCHLVKKKDMDYTQPKIQTGWKDQQMNWAFYLIILVETLKYAGMDVKNLYALA